MQNKTFLLAQQVEFFLHIVRIFFLRIDMHAVKIHSMWFQIP